MDQARVSIAAVPIMPPSTGVRRLWSSTACPACEGPSDDWLSSSGGRAYLNAMQTTSDTLALIGNTPLVRLKGPSEESGCDIYGQRSEEHTYELQSLMRTSYAGFCLKKKT